MGYTRLEMKMNLYFSLWDGGWIFFSFFFLFFPSFVFWGLGDFLVCGFPLNQRT